MRLPLIVIASLVVAIRSILAAEKEAPNPTEAPKSVEAPKAAAADSAVKAGIAEAQSNFTSAFNTGDAKLLAASFTSDADWIDDQGAIMRGRAPILRALEDSIAAHKGRTMSLRLDSVRTLGPDVTVGNATSTFTAPDKTNETAAFIAVWVKQDGKWLISVLTETSEVEEEE